MKCYPVYWSYVDESRKHNQSNVVSVLRGTWFFEVNWQPLDDKIATRLEREHLARFKGYDVDHIKVYNCTKQEIIMNCPSCFIYIYVRGYTYNDIPLIIFW